MTLNRWDPLRDLLNFQEKMNRFVEIRTQRTLFQRSAVWTPLVDLLETPDAYIFRAELPGVGKKNISIEIQGRRLKLSGERHLESEPQLAAYHSVERAHGPFERSFNLPDDADVEKAEARYEDGILEVYVPKSDEEPERILTVVTLR
jgi:HSP20 family protein